VNVMTLVVDPLDGAHNAGSSSTYRRSRKILRASMIRIIIFLTRILPSPVPRFWLVK
jgi:hypothetical protein